MVPPIRAARDDENAGAENASRAGSLHRRVQYSGITRLERAEWAITKLLMRPEAPRAQIGVERCVQPKLRSRGCESNLRFLCEIAACTSPHCTVLAELGAALMLHKLDVSLPMRFVVSCSRSTYIPSAGTFLPRTTSFAFSIFPSRR